MKKFFIVDECISSERNGIGPFIRAYINCLSKMDVEINILSFNDNVDEFEITMKNKVCIFRFPRFPNGRFLQNYQTINRFLKLYISDSPENIFCLNHSPCLALMQTLRKSFPLSKLVFTIHDLGWCNIINGNSSILQEVLSEQNKKKCISNYKTLIDNFQIERQMYEIVDIVVCLSQSTVDILKNIYLIPEQKIKLIPNGMKRIYIQSGVDCLKIRQNYSIPINKKIILYAGRLTKAKGVYALLNAFYEVYQIYPDSHLILAGDAGKEWCHFHTIAKKIDSQITVTGFISKKELYNLYQITDIGIIPSYYEQCPYVGIEMQMYGIPIISSDCNGLKDMFQDGVNAKIAKIGKQEDTEIFEANIKKAIIELLENMDLVNTLKCGSIKCFSEKYSIRAMRNRYVKLYNTF